jgi:hypothetical protein
MDVGANKPFKDRIRDKYNRWFFNQGCTNKPQRDDVAKWVNANLHFNESRQQQSSKLGKELD